MWKLTFCRAHLANASLAIAYANTVALMSTEQIFSCDAQTVCVVTACVFVVLRGWRVRQLLHMLCLSLQKLMEMM